MVTITDSHPILPNLPNLYQQDYFLWLETTAQQLKNGQLNHIDLANLIEEIEDLGKREKRGIESNLEKLLMHLLKYNIKGQSELIVGVTLFTNIEIPKGSASRCAFKRHLQTVLV